MADLQAVADRVEIEALRGEFSDAATTNDYDRIASLFTPDAIVRIPEAGLEAVGTDQIRAMGGRQRAAMEVFIQTTHPGVVELDGDLATGRAYLCELIRLRDGRSHFNYGIYHDRYRRTADGWKFTERVYELRYVDDSPLTGVVPHDATASA